MTEIISQWAHEICVLIHWLHAAGLTTTLQIIPPYKWPTPSSSWNQSLLHYTCSWLYSVSCSIMWLGILSQSLLGFPSRTQGKVLRLPGSHVEQTFGEFSLDFGFYSCCWNAHSPLLPGHCGSVAFEAGVGSGILTQFPRGNSPTCLRAPSSMFLQGLATSRAHCCSACRFPAFPHSESLHMYPFCLWLFVIPLYNLL